MCSEADSKKRGPKPETLKAEGVDWQDAIKHALEKEKPEEWPEPGQKRKKGSSESDDSSD